MTLTIRNRIERSARRKRTSSIEEYISSEIKSLAGNFVPLFEPQRALTAQVSRKLHDILYLGERIDGKVDY